MVLPADHLQVQGDGKKKKTQACPGGALTLSLSQVGAGGGGGGGGEDIRNVPGGAGGGGVVMFAMIAIHRSL